MPGIVLFLRIVGGSSFSARYRPVKLEIRERDSTAPSRQKPAVFYPSGRRDVIFLRNLMNRLRSIVFATPVSLFGPTAAI